MSLYDGSYLRAAVQPDKLNDKCDALMQEYLGSDDTFKFDLMKSDCFNGTCFVFGNAVNC